jgi:hypothetical protein
MVKMGMEIYRCKMERRTVLGRMDQRKSFIPRGYKNS